MARFAHTPVTLPGIYANVGQLLTMVAAVVADKEEVVMTGKEIIIAHNTGVGARTVTVTSTPDATTGRTGDITAFSIPAGGIAIFGGPFPKNGWKQTNSKLNFEGSHAEVEFGVITLP